MAAKNCGDEKVEEILTCTICLEIFKVPRYLPCLHTFCESCLDTYIASSFSKKDDTSAGFKCPVCQIFVSVEETAGLPGKWTEQIPLNNLIDSLIERKMVEKSEKRCNSCFLNNDNQIAVAWCVVCQEAFCSTCVKYHKNFKISSKHNIVDISSITTDNADIIMAGPVACSKHKEKIVEVYCLDHSAPCCTVCASVDHRKCENVVTIDTVVAGFKGFEEANEVAKTLDELSLNLEEVFQQRTELVSNIEEESNEMMKTVEQFKDTIIQHINKLEKSVRSEIECTKKQMLLPLKDETTQVSSYQSTVNNWKNIFQACLVHGSELQCFIEAKKISSRKNQLVGDIYKLVSKMSTSSITFTNHEVLVELPTTIQALGKLEVKNTKFNCTLGLPTVNFRTGNIRVLHTIEVDIKRTGRRAISGMFIDDAIILTDEANSVVLKYNDKGKYENKLQLNGKPTDITNAGEGRVAVIENESTIVVINVKDMTTHKKITTSSSIFGLRYVGETFICVSNNTISYINKSDGKLLKARKTSGDTWFLWAANSNNIVFTDGVQVSGMIDDKVKFDYNNKELKNPRGIDTDFEGNIYICGFKSNNVHQLTGDGTLIRIIPASQIGVTEPWIIRFTQNSNKFLLTSYSDGKVLICNIE